MMRDQAEMLIQATAQEMMQPAILEHPIAIQKIMQPAILEHPIAQEMLTLVTILQVQAAMLPEADVKTTQEMLIQATPAETTLEI